ncbi:XTP/dITP diphosphatase [Anaerolineales bacterium HSG25]|nr:XTP/dITP diphosphatase [Anaerolineales bacterium HSG25]
MTKLLIATNNAHKIEEFQEILADLPYTLTSPKQEGLNLDPEETGTTFEANAIIKAEAFAQASGLLTLADDSGLEVDALDGAPGVYSARYGDTAKDDHVGRYQLLLEQLADVPTEQRTARFRCVIALATPNKIVGTVDGAVEGRIATAPKGSGGFGYDPVFFVPELDKIMAELTSAQKHAISHRGRAGKALIPLLSSLGQQD